MIYDEIIYLILNAFRIYIIAKYNRLFFEDEKVGTKIKFLFYALFYILNSILHIFFNNPVINILNNIILLTLIAMYIYKDSFVKKIIATIMIVAVNMTFEDILVLIFMRRGIGMIDEISISTVSVFLFFIVEIILEKKMREKSKMHLSAAYSFPLLLIPLGSIFISHLIIVGRYKEQILSIIGIFAIIIINICVFYLYEEILNAYLEKWKNIFLKTQLEMYNNQFFIMKESQSLVREFRHDLKHHVKMIGDLVRHGEEEEIFEYLKQMAAFIDYDKEYVSTGNEGIDCVLNFMIEEGKRIEATVKSCIMIPVNIRISTFDLNVLLSNLLNNAIKALSKAEKKELSIYIKEDKGILVLRIVNTYEGIIKEKDGNIITSETNKELHGIGLNNIKKIVNKYNGIMNIDYTNNEFKVDIMLYLDKTVKHPES